MYRSLAIIVTALLTAAPCASTQAGPLLKMLEEKKAKQAGTEAGTEPSTEKAGTMDDKDARFDDAKRKCQELGNKEGSDKYNSCVMTLME